jgi:V/A-type H+-transporting ATPase subunit E
MRRNACVSEGLDRLVEEIVRESRTKAEEIRKSGLAQIDERLAMARAEATREADQIIRNLRTECDGVVNRRVSQEKQKARLAYLSEKNKVLEEVMKDVQARLLEFCRNDSSYRSFLLKSIAQGIDAVPGEKAKVALSEKDIRRYKGTKLLEDVLSTMRTTKTAVLSDEPIETIGGAVVKSQDDRVRVDCTLEARLELIRPQLLAEVSRILFLS